MRNIYGDEIDILLWDSGITDSDKFLLEVFMRQALISGKCVSFIFGGKYDELHFT
jgi:hypothetical protein